MTIKAFGYMVTQGNVNNKAKQPESGDLCGDITEFGVPEGSPDPAR